MMQFDELIQKEKADVYLTRENMRYLAGDKYFVIWDDNTGHAELVPYLRVGVTGSSNQNANGFIDRITAYTIDEIYIKIQPLEKVIHLTRQQYEVEFDSFFNHMQQKEVEAKRR